jgi:hypothetical protein
MLRAGWFRLAVRWEGTTDPTEEESMEDGKLLAYWEADERGWGPNRHTLTAEEAVRRQRLAATGRGVEYGSDEEALADFMANNWAFWVEE